MRVNTKHPEYSKREKSWNICRDTYAGEEIVKSKSVHYLPPTPGMKFDGLNYGDSGWTNYQQYLLRAVYHNYMADAVETIIGLLHSKPANIQLPAKLEFLRDNSTPIGEPLQFLLRKINVEQLITGRVGLLLDLDEEPGQEILPKISIYAAENIINWDYNTKANSYSFVVLDESGIKRNGFEWRQFEQYRILSIEESPGTEQNSNSGTYNQIVVKGNEIYASSEPIYPKIRGATLEKIPFVIINSNDIHPQTDDPPLNDLANMSLSIYRSEADYRQTLFQLSQDTLVVIGAENSGLQEGNERIGAGAAIFLPPGGDAKYIGINNAGISEQRAALENDKVVANNKSVQLIDTRSGQRESGQALHIRAAAQTATLNQIALTAAGALEQLLKVAAEWVGANPEEVKVDPNTDFISESFVGSDLVSIMHAISMGAPLSKESLHALMVERGLTTKDYEEERDLLEEEADENIMKDIENKDSRDGGDNDQEDERDGEERKDRK